MSVFVTFDGSLESWADISDAVLNSSVYELKVEYTAKVKSLTKNSFESFMRSIIPRWRKNMKVSSTVVTSYAEQFGIDVASERYSEFASELDETEQENMFEITVVCHGRTVGDNQFARACASATGVQF